MGYYMAVTIHNPNNWRSIGSQTCFNCKFRRWINKSQGTPSYCTLEPKISFLDGNLRPSRFVCNLWKKWGVKKSQPKPYAPDVEEEMMVAAEYLTEEVEDEQA